MIKRGLCLLLCVLMLAGSVACANAEKGDVLAVSAPYNAPTAAPTAEPAATAEPTPEPTPEPTASPVPSPTPEPYESPIDFAALQAVNPDIYAWLRIEDTKIDYPVTQSETDDEYYLHHNSDGNVSMMGAIFSQKTYNAKDFTDPVTVLYGHNMKSGAMFGTLRQSYTDQTFFDGHKTIQVYTPSEMLEYKVFAAVPYSDELIPYKYDFKDEKVFKWFFDAVFNIRDLSAKFDEANRPEAGDRVIILSTCISGTDLRFLVMASLKPDHENRSES